MNPAGHPVLLCGVVRHQRLRPARNAFAYGVYALRLPLRALEAQPARWENRWFSHNRFNLLSFHDADHGDGASTPLAWVEATLRAAGVHDADGEIWLQTFPRVLGYVFNPVSFWFCERADGALRAVVCEVNNTFGERHCYVLHNGAPLGNGMPLHAAKAFHVSPFCAVAGDYIFRFAQRDAGPAQRCVARIDYRDGDGVLLLTSISGTTRALDARSVLSAFCRYPFMSLGVICRIHWQALKLWLKGVPFHARPAPSSARPAASGPDTGLGPPSR